jgi:antitoxin VapB
MQATAKVFANGHSQAIRLPKAFRVNVDEMWITRNELTGEITLKPKDAESLRKQRLDTLIALITEDPLPESFLSEASRQNKPPKNPFEAWESPATKKTPAKRTSKPKVRP